MTPFAILPPLMFAQSIRMHLDEIGTIIVDTGYRIHRGLGPGLLESVYRKIFARDLARSGMHVEREKWISFEYDGLWFENAFKADLVVEKCVIVEIKSVAELKPVHYLQLLTYLRVTNLRLGYLINFASPLYKAGVKRILNDYQTDVHLTRRYGDTE
jgi:GxxExxY protein